MNTNLLIFSSSNYNRNNPKLFDNTYKKYFNNIIIYNENDLDNYILNIIKNIINNYGNCGFGFWIWKPYLILKELSKMKNNDILFYIDSHFFINDESIIERIIKDLNKSKKPIFSGNNCVSNDYIWTTTKLVKCVEQELNYKFSEEELKQEHNDAGLLFIRKTKFTVKFFRQMLDIMLNNFEYITNEHNGDPDNNEGFIENRHDQSLFNLMIKYYKIKSPKYIKYGDFITEW